MSTLYIRLPSKAAADSAPNWHSLACPFALVSNGNSIEQGIAPLSDLSGTVAKSLRVVLLLAASDVTILRLQVPPLSSSRLKAALPNLVEDQLITDPSGCVVVAGGSSEGLRTIAVVQSAWLDTLAKAFTAFGARHVTALPAQLCLPYPSVQTGQPDQPGSVAAFIEERDDAGQHAEIDMTLRLSERDGIGLAIAHEKDEPAAHVAIRTLCAVVPEAPITLYVPQSLVRAFQEVVNDTIALSNRINVSADNWSRWIAGANATMLDLMAGSDYGTGPKLDWRPWRWPLALTAAVLVINAAALNIDWWRLRREADSLRVMMIQIYKSAYPNESVIIDPLAQMQQKIAAARHDSGIASPEDFTAIMAAFGEAWSNVVTAAGLNTAIAALDYRERSLFVRLKPVLSKAEGPGSESPTQKMQAALAKYGLALDPAHEQSGAIVWQIRSAK